MVHVIDCHGRSPGCCRASGEGDVVTHCFHGSEGGALLDETGTRRSPRRSPLASAAFSSTSGTGSAASPSASRGRRSRRASRPTRSRATSTSTTSTARCSTRRRRCRSSSPRHGPPAVIEATTAAPARAIRREDTLGSLAVGREADITVLELARQASTASTWSTPGTASTSSAERQSGSRPAVGRAAARRSTVGQSERRSGSQRRQLASRRRASSSA